MNNFSYIIGLDIGNSNTKAVILKKNVNNHNYEYLDSYSLKTTGIKGTIENFIGCQKLIEKVMSKNLLTNRNNIKIKINHAAPVISDLSIDTISETQIIDSAMIGHNPDTPGGEGIAFGELIWIQTFSNLNEKNNLNKEKKYIVIVDSIYFMDVVYTINNLISKNWNICGLIIKNDDAVLISNRINKKMPILDEVNEIYKLISGNMAAIEVAKKGKTLEVLSDTYEIATLFNLSPKETQECILISKNFIGKRSGVIIKTKNAKFITRKVKAGCLNIYDIKNNVYSIDVNSGAKKIMQVIKKCDKIIDVMGEKSTNSQILIDKIKTTMSNLTNDNIANMKISDILAIDTWKFSNILGSLAGENVMESVVMLAAQVQTSKLSINSIANKIQNHFNIECSVFGYEADMAIRGALTTPGTEEPLVILDLGGGSTDAAIIQNNHVDMIHCAGAGDMVTKIIDLELNLNDIQLSELIKCYPLAKVTGLLKLTFENDDVHFLDKPLPADFFSKIIILKDNEYIPIKNINKHFTMERIVRIRRKAKEKIFLVNALRALQNIAPKNDISNIKSIVLVGGSSQDFEICDILFNGLIDYRITIGKAKLMGILPAYYAVALGLAIS